MPVSATPVQYVPGASASGATSLSVTLTSTTAGNLLVAIVAVGSTASTGSCPTPSGWTLGAGPVTTEVAADVNLYLFWKITPGGETSFTATDTVSSGITIQVYEWSASTGWPASPVDVTATAPNQATTTTPVSGTTAATAQADELWVAAMTTHFGTGEVYSSPTNGFTVSGAATAGSGSFFAPSTGALYKVPGATGTAGTQATVGTSKPFAGLIVTFKANAGGSTVIGQATLSAGLSQSAAAAVTYVGQSPLSGSLSLSAQAVMTYAAQAALSGQLDMVAAAAMTLIAQAALSGQLSMQATAIRAVLAQANLSGALSMQSQAQMTLAGSAPLSGGLSLAAQAQLTLAAAAALSAALSMSATAITGNQNYIPPTATIVLLAWLAASLTEPSGLSADVALLSVGPEGTITL